MLFCAIRSGGCAFGIVGYFVTGLSLGVFLVFDLIAGVVQMRVRQWEPSIADPLILAAFYCKFFKHSVSSGF